MKSQTIITSCRSIWISEFLRSRERLDSAMPHGGPQRANQVKKIYLELLKSFDECGHYLVRGVRLAGTWEKITINLRVAWDAFIANFWPLALMAFTSIRKNWVFGLMLLITWNNCSSLISGSIDANIWSTLVIIDFGAFEILSYFGRTKIAIRFISVLLAWWATA